MASPQIDFDQAMSDFKTMFPGLNADVIEAVLRANNGDVDGTIDQLLNMTSSEEPNVPENSLETRSQMALPAWVSDSTMSASLIDFSPGPIENSGGGASQKSPFASNFTTSTPQYPSHLEKRQDVFLPNKDFNLINLGEDDNGEQCFAQGASSSSSAAVNISSGQEKAFSKLAMSARTESHHSSSPRLAANAKEKEARLSVSPSSLPNTSRSLRYHPALLGDLPDDFLTLGQSANTDPTTSDPPPSYNSVVMNSPAVAAAANAMTEQLQAQQQFERQMSQRQQGQYIGMSEQEQYLAALHQRYNNNVAGGGGASFPRLPPGKTSLNGFNQRRTMSLHSSPAHAGGNGMYPVNQASPSNTSGASAMAREMRLDQMQMQAVLLQEKLTENSWQRQVAKDPELERFLEDERIAILLQNKELLRELKSDPEFLAALDKDYARSKQHAKLSKKKAKRKSFLKLTPKENSGPEIQGPIGVATLLNSSPRPAASSTETHDMSTGPGGNVEDDILYKYKDDVPERSMDGTTDFAAATTPVGAAAFPYTKEIPKEDDVAFIEKLKYMSKNSKQKFALTARKFIKRHKGAKGLLGTSDSHQSGVCLLDSTDDNVGTSSGTSSNFRKYGLETGYDQESSGDEDDAKDTFSKPTNLL